MGVFENMLRIFTREEILTPRMGKVEPASDVDIIKQRFPGQKEITISLQELLELVPRRRHRTDAYRGLVAELKEKEGIELNIRSRKKKKEA